MLKINITSFDLKKEFLIDLKNSDINIDKNIIIDDFLKIFTILTKEKESVIIAQGNVSGKIKLICSRCLDEIWSLINNNFTAIFKDRKLIRKDDIEADVLPYENNIVDLFDLVRQTIIMEIPMKPLCKQDCAGLCPVCGNNLNREKCDCQTQNFFKPFKDIIKN